MAAAEGKRRGGEVGLWRAGTQPWAVRSDHERGVLVVLSGVMGRLQGLCVWRQVGPPEVSAVGHSRAPEGWGAIGQW